ncbi:MAG TPA: NAD(P)-dependent oxidoreductase [Alphaproteobacteria bacterium]|nr:NAD(P)-dependent oxidoreductase [Alphaproteobacteria bacterium]
MATTRKMLRFVDIGQNMPDKRTPEARRRDFNEIYAEFDRGRAAEQASRCSQCGVPFCQVHCPLHNNIPDWLKLTAEDRLEEAYEVAQATNNFPEICGRICPQDRLCEGNCVIEKGYEAVTIGSVEKYITDTAWTNGWVRPPRPVHELAASVGIIGAGPAGLAAAEQLRRKGYVVDVYDRYDRVGGLLVYGIPNFKLEKQVVERRAQLLADGGVTFHLNFEVGRDARLDDLRQRHDAVLIASGVYKARDIQAPGVGLANMFQAMEFLVASNRKGLGDDVPAFDDGTLDAAGKDVVVIGGGDTAMDCVRTAVRQGARSVSCLYRRDRANMPGSQREVYHAEEEGVRFVWLAAPEAFIGRGAASSGKGKRKSAEREAVAAVRAIRMRLGIADSSGRQMPETIPGSSFQLPADIVIKALGFDPENMPAIFDAPDLAVTRWGTLKIDWRTMMTNLDGVFAAGDIVRGASLVVWAVRDGRDAAEAIHRYVQRKRAAAATDGLASAAD